MEVTLLGFGSHKRCSRELHRGATYLQDSVSFTDAAVNGGDAVWVHLGEKQSFLLIMITISFKILQNNDLSDEDLKVSGVTSPTYIPKSSSSSVR